MNRHVRILDHAAATLLLAPLKTAVVITVYALMVAVLLSLLAFVEAHRREAEAILEAAPDVIVQRVRGGRRELMPDDRVAAIERINGVSGARPRVWGYSYDPPTRATFTLWGAESVPREALGISEGELQAAREGGSCVVGAGVADLRFLGVGDRLPVLGSDGALWAPRVCGIFMAESGLLTNDLVVLPTAMARDILAIGDGLCTDIAVGVHNPAEVDTVARKIAERWPDARVLTRRQILETYNAVFDWRGGVWLVVLLGAVAAFAILVWDRATGLSAEEYRAIGVLRAVGWKTREVLELKVWEGTVTSAIALLGGVILAQVHLTVFDGRLFAPVIRGWSVLYPSFPVAGGPTVYGVLLCVSVAVLPYVAASLIPAWRAAVTDPDSVMRS